jgi:four helix bundle protein
MSTHKNVIRDKSYAFAVSIVQSCTTLLRTRKESVLSKQLIRSGTSVGANIEEAIGAQSRKDFIAKLSIAYKEARESLYWIRLLTDTRFLDEAQSATLVRDCNELLRILTAIIRSSKNKD